jgi:hypothetical protein
VPGSSDDPLRENDQALEGRRAQDWSGRWLEATHGRQRDWDRKYGEGQWAVGYVIDGAFVLQEAALDSIYNRSYEEHFAAQSFYRAS